MKKNLLKEKHSYRNLTTLKKKSHNSFNYKHSYMIFQVIYPARKRIRLGNLFVTGSISNVTMSAQAESLSYATIKKLVKIFALSNNN